MSVGTSSGNYISSNTTFPTGFAAGTARTWMAWAKLTTDTNAYGLLHVWGQVGGNYGLIGVATSGTTSVLEVNGSATTGAEITLNKWYHFCYVRNGASHTFYLSDSTNIGGVATLTASTDTTFGSSEWAIGQYSGGLPWSGRVEHVKEWAGRAMNTDEIRREMFSVVPVDRRSLYRWLPLKNQADILDHSGFNRLSTRNGTLTTQDSPPLLLVPAWKKPTGKRSAAAATGYPWHYYAMQRAA